MIVYLAEDLLVSVPEGKDGGRGILEWRNGGDGALERWRYCGFTSIRFRNTWF